MRFARSIRNPALRLLLLLLALPVFAGTAVAAILFAISFLMVRSDMRQIDVRQRVLLYRTDHRTIRDSCRAMLRAKDAFPEGVYLRDDARLPAPIRRLEPSHVSVRPREVVIEMGGGFYHYGFHIYEDIPQPVGGKPLIPGLYYYTENGRIPPPARPPSL